MLVTRGVPFSERTVGTAQDIEALRRISGQASVPLLTIGTQQLKGFSDGQWSQYLDAAGYPESNQLPAGYSRAPATPLVALQPAAAASATPEAAAAAPAPPRPATPVPRGPTIENPAGIRF